MPSQKEWTLRGTDVLTSQAAETVATDPGRVGALDGLRGLVIVSVVLNHAGGMLWSRGSLYDVPVVSGLLGGGAVILFFVVGGFIVADGLLREQAGGRFDPWRFYLRRLVRLGGQLIAVCVVVAIAFRFEDSAPSGDRVLTNVLHVLTYTFNRLAADNLLAVENEFGHLWYLGVQQQSYIVLPLLIALLGRWRPGLVIVLVAASVLVYVHRQDVLAERGWVIASSLTTTRSDGLMLGVAFAAALPWLGRLRGWGHVLWISGLGLVALKLVLPELGTNAYLKEWSIPFTILSGVVVTAIWLLPRPTRVSRALSWAPLRRMGKASLAIFIWHFPIIVVVSRHTGTWTWPERTIFSLAILIAVVWASERWIDGPIRRLLATKSVFRISRESRS